jgi:hypothetical protein
MRKRLATRGIEQDDQAALKCRSNEGFIGAQERVRDFVILAVETLQLMKFGYLPKLRDAVQASRKRLGAATVYLN